MPTKTKIQLPFPRLFGNRLIVKHIGSNVQSSIIIVPDNHRPALAGISAEVLQVGEKFVGKDDVSVGDTVIVPQHFGDRGLVKDDRDAIIYHGDDILGVVRV